jgi:hypothetical protein
MSAARHSTDANDAAKRLHTAIQDLRDKAAHGQHANFESLDALLKSIVCLHFNTARTMYAVHQFPVPDRRDHTVRAPASTDIPTPLAALEALLAECELTLDYRPTFRHAMSDAHASIQQAKKPRTVLHGTVELGESIGDDSITLGELFDIPAPVKTDPAVLAFARGMAATDGSGAVVREVAHG